MHNELCIQNSAKGHAHHFCQAQNVRTKYLHSIWLMYPCGTMGHLNKKSANYI